MSPRDRYCNDPMFHSLVDMMVAAIMDAKYTPSEMRDAALLASIKYEELHVHPRAYPKEIIDWLNKKGNENDYDCPIHGLQDGPNCPRC